MNVPAEHLEEMRVCGPCGCAVGPFLDGPDGRRLVQSGSCPSHGSAESDPGRPGRGSGKLVQLCLCCGAVALEGSGRYSVWFCRRCTSEVVLLNARLGRYAIPIGRHGVLADLTLGLGDAPDARKVGSLEAVLDGSGEVGYILRLWGAEAVRLNLASLGVDPGSSMPVREYCRGAADRVDPAERFRQMCAYVDPRGRRLLDHPLLRGTGTAEPGAPPFRVEPRTTGVATPSLLSVVGRARSATHEQRRAWAMHPDEAIAARLARTVWLRSWGRDTAEARALLLIRGLAAARAEGHFWNPILDGVALGRIPSRRDIDAAATLLGVDPTPYHGATFATVLAPLKGWLHSQSDPRTAERLLAFRFKPIAGELAEHGPLDERLVLRLVERDGTLSARAAENPRLDEPTAEALFDWALRHVVRPGVRHLGEYALTIDRLDARGLRPVTRSDVDRLFRALGVRRTGSQPWQRAAEALVRLRRHLGREDVEALYPHVAFNVRLLVRLMDASAFDVTMVREALRLHRDGRLRVRAAQHPAWRKDPEVLAVLSRSTLPDVLAPVLDETEDEPTFRRLFKRMARYSVDRALEYLRQSASAERRLHPDDVAPLLRAEERRRSEPVDRSSASTLSRPVWVGYWCSYPGVGHFVLCLTCGNKNRPGPPGRGVSRLLALHEVFPLRQTCQRCGALLVRGAADHYPEMIPRRGNKR